MRELAKVADVILVVGAKNSSNSNRLCEIGREEGVPSYLIADGSELDPEWVRGKKVVGLTAGASAPERLVEDVIEALGAHRARRSRPDGRQERTYRVPPAGRAEERSRPGGVGTENDVGIPVQQAARIGAYVMKQHLTGKKRYPLVLMLEPLFRCNLACAGCGKIDYPDEILNQRLSYQECMDAIDECGAPAVSIAGGEPLLHREMPQIVQGFLERNKFVILCTNALLLTKKIDQYKPHPNFTWSIHLDGDKAMHDKSVCLDGVYEKAVDAIKLAKSKGFRTQINCTLFDDADPERVAAFFDEMMAMGLDGITISPGYAYERAPDQEQFPQPRAHQEPVPRHPCAAAMAARSGSSPSPPCSSISSPATRPMNARPGRCRCAACSAGRSPATCSAKAM